METKSESGLVTQAENPVNFCHGGALLDYVERLEKIIINWDSVGTVESRAGDCLEILRLMKKDFDKGYVNGGVYLFSNSPIGVVQFGMEGGFLVIKNIVTHPAFAGCGGALMEYAVDISCKNRCDGDLKLYSVARASSAYLAMGFKFEKSAKKGGDAGDMTLMVDNSIKWEKSGETYVLKKHAAESYALAIKDQPLNLEKV